MTLSLWKRLLTRPHLRLIALVGVIVPRRLRADWRLEWEAELRHREALLADWDRLNLRSKLDLLWRSASAFWGAIVASFIPARRAMKGDPLTALRHE